MAKHCHYMYIEIASHLLLFSHHNRTILGVGTVLGNKILAHHHNKTEMVYGSWQQPIDHDADAFTAFMCCGQNNFEQRASYSTPYITAMVYFWVRIEIKDFFYDVTCPVASFYRKR